MNEKETKFCNGTFECFGCPEQGEGNCYISGCPWVARFEEIKDKFAVAWFKREFPDIIEEILNWFKQVEENKEKLKKNEKRFREMFKGG